MRLLPNAGVLLDLLIREARRRCNLTQTDLARRASLHQSIISGIESGKRNPTLRTLKRLAAAMELDLVVRLEERNSASRSGGGLRSGSGTDTNAGIGRNAPDRTLSDGSENQ